MNKIHTERLVSATTVETFENGAFIISAQGASIHAIPIGIDDLAYLEPLDSVAYAFPRPAHNRDFGEDTLSFPTIEAMTRPQRRVQLWKVTGELPEGGLQYQRLISHLMQVLTSAGLDPYPPKYISGFIRVSEAQTGDIKYDERGFPIDVVLPPNTRGIPNIIILSLLKANKLDQLLYPFKTVRKAQSAQQANCCICRNGKVAIVSVEVDADVAANPLSLILRDEMNTYTLTTPILKDAPHHAAKGNIITSSYYSELVDAFEEI